MKTIFIILLIYFNTLILTAASVELSNEEKNWLVQHPIITLGSDSSWAPFIIDNNGFITGYDKDILTLINEKTGANFQLILGDWKDMVEKAMNKEIDGLSTSVVHKERENYFNFSDTYANTQKYLITLANNQEDIYTLNDLTDKKIAYQEANLFDKKLLTQYQNSILVPYSSIEEQLEDLVNGKIDFVLGNHDIFFTAEKKKLPYLKIAYKVLNSELDLVFSLRKDYPEAISILNKGLKAISIEENIAIDKKWFSSSHLLNKNSLFLTKEEKEYIKNKKVLKVSNLDTFTPFNFYERGRPRGYSVDYMNIVGEYLDTKIEFVSNKTWAENLIMLKKGEIDLIPHAAITEERKEYMSFTDFDHIEHITGVAISKNSGLKSVKDLKDKVIAVTNNSFVEAYFEKEFPHYTILSTQSTAKSIEALSLGHADVAIGSLPSLNYYIQKNWLSNVKTVVLNDLGIPLKTIFPMAVSKDNLILKSILEKVDASISYREKSKLRQKWMSITPLEFTNSEITAEELAYLKTKRSIKMCVLPDSPPFSSIDINTEYKGIGADFIALISKYIDKPIELVPTKKWSESLQNIKDRKCDILPVAINVPSRKDYLNFTEPYVKEPFVVVTKLDEFYVKDSSDLSNKKIGVNEDYALIEILNEKNPLIQVVGVKNIEEGLKKVRSGELYGYVDTLSTVAYGIQKYSLFDLKIAGNLEFNIELAIASRNDEALLTDIMQKALDAISEERKRAIINKWVEIKVAQDFDYKTLWQISAFFLFIILAVLYKNRAVILVNQELTKANKIVENQQKMVDDFVLILSTDTKGIITDVNGAFCRAIGYTKEELIGEPHRIMRHPDMKDSYFKELWETITNNAKWSGEIKNLTKNQTTIIFIVNIEPIFEDDIKIGYRSISEDITDKKRIEELSVTDKLTGLYNRLKLDELMLIKIEEFSRYKTDFSIILIDIDDFKMVNDTYGHDVGDYVLQTLANILKENVRISDIVSRWGGEEFIIVCSNTDLSECKVIAENLRVLVEETNFEKVGRKTISLGITQFHENDDAKSIFKRADDALHEAKSKGKNRVCTI